jgi:cell division inhibitor SepF
MSALRRAGVWLGLIEDEAEDAAYEAEFDRAARSRQRVSSRRYDDAYPADDEPVPPRASRVDGNRPTERVATRRDGAEQRAATVRSITRDVRDSRDTTVSFPTRDNLALAPEVKPPDPVVAEAERRYHITTLHPTTYREARTIGEHFREGTPVIMNLTEMEEADARRLVDFGAGLAFGLRGTMERVTNRVFLLSPANVHVTAEDKAKIAEGEFFRPR